ncbi:uncharacterized protein LOC120071958 [Benincasa hispida]|uniref:uncharacterized protein LOC120071958 n=1 Tax=Benincasa hispida TaxID=102211 RepID=UPI0019007767|nr:uncharacterized protein LOC120071958 [Benincasa hispida]
MKGVLRFGKKGKLSPRFVGPFEILERVGFMAYHLALPLCLSAVHNVFHVSMLRKYLMKPSHVVDFEPLQLNENLSYEEKPAQIVASEVKVLRSKEVPLVKLTQEVDAYAEADLPHRRPHAENFSITKVNVYVQHMGVAIIDRIRPSHRSCDHQAITVIA